MKGMLFIIALFIFAVAIWVEWNQAITMRQLTVLMVCGLLGWYFLRTDAKE